jgi:hypothetical protein
MIGKLVKGHAITKKMGGAYEDRDINKLVIRSCSIGVGGKGNNEVRETFIGEQSRSIQIQINKG